MVVVTFFGVPMDGGIVICGSVGWILVVTNTSLTRDLFPSHGQSIIDGQKGAE